MPESTRLTPAPRAADVDQDRRPIERRIRPRSSGIKIDLRMPTYRIRYRETADARHVDCTCDRFAQNRHCIHLWTLSALVITVRSGGAQ